VNRLSLRARMVLITITLLTLGMLASDSVVLVTLRGPLIDRVDSQLRLVGTVLARIPLTAPQQAASGLGKGLDLIDQVYLGYLDEDGRVVRELRPGASGGPSLGNLSTKDGQTFDDDSGQWRVFVTDKVPGPGSVVVAASLGPVEATMARVRTICLLVGLGVLALLAAAGWFWVRAGLRPLRRIEETSAAIAGGDLSRRVPELAAPQTEIGRLAASLNGMLGRIERADAARTASETRMRRFVADASHEMRTPLAGISGSAELYRMGALSEPSEVAATFGRVEGEAQRLGRLVEDLLLLAQLDEGTGGLRLAPMDLRTLAADALHDLRALDPTREIELTGTGGAPVLGDEARLRQVVSNLVGNAIAHTPSGSPIRIQVGTVDGRAVLEISDHGPGLTPEQAARVFDRFYRADSSRSRATGGAGLGLSIALSLVTAQGGVLELETAPGQGATFRLALTPLRPRAPGLD
jgi:two-component system OmpR family sensor kinase